MPANAIVNIKRPKKYFGSLCKIDVYLDGQKQTIANQDQYITLEVLPGFHRLYCQLWKQPSEIIEWHALEGQSINLECEFIDVLSPHAYWGSAVALGLLFPYGYGLFGLNWLYIIEVHLVFCFLCFFVQSGGIMWSCWLHDKQWGKQQLRLFLAPEDQNSVQVIPSTAKQKHDHPFSFILMPFITAIILTVYFYFVFNVILPAIFH